MQSVEDCRGARVAPSLAKGATRSDGCYYRNLNHLPKRYPKDSDPEPVFGRRVRPASLRWDPGLSVNCAQCISTAECSIVLDHHAEKHKFVLELHLAPLAELTGVSMVAVYEPVEENVCHFELLPLDGEVEDLKQAIEQAFDVRGSGDPSWPDVSVPHSQDEIASANRMKARFDRAFRVAFRRESG